MTYEQKLKGDFKNFLFVVWKFLGLPSPTPRQYAIADYLQSKDRRRIVEGFRGVGKSWITSAYVLWRLYCDADYKVLVVSASKARSDDFAAFTKRLIREMPILKYLQAKEGQRDSMIAFDVGPCRAAHAPSVKSAGIFGQITGSRAVEIIADDIEVPNNSATQDLRDKLLKACLEFEAIIMPEVGTITYLGTPQTEESVYNKLRTRGYGIRIWPSRFPVNPEKYDGGLAPDIMQEMEADPALVGIPTDPDRFDEQDLTEREGSYGRSGFALQFMLDTSLSDAEKYPLKTGDLIVMALNEHKAPISVSWSSSPECQLKDLALVGFTGDRWYRPLFMDEKWIPYEGSVMFIDPSGRGKDETTYAVVKLLHGTLFLTAVGGMNGGYEDVTLAQLATVARDQKVNKVLVESNFGDGMFTQLFKPILTRHHAVSIEEVRHNIQKEKRIIDTLEPVMNRHKLVVDLQLVKDDAVLLKDRLNYSLFYQLTRITKQRGALRHDDRLDALAGAVAYWVEAMARDELIAVEDYSDRVFQEEIENFMEHAVGISGKGKRLRFTGGRS